jgi:hypothetical protein
LDEQTEKPGYGINYLRGKKRPRPEGAVIREIKAMPIPVAWGVKPKTSAADSFILIRGSIFIERLNVRLMPKANEDDELLSAISTAERNSYFDSEESFDEQYDEYDSYDSYSRTEFNYRNKDAADEVKIGLPKKKNKIIFRMVVGLITCAFLSMIEILPEMGEDIAPMFLPDRSPYIYLTINMVIALVVIFLQRDVIASGVSALLRKRVTADSLIAAACFISVAHVTTLFIYHAVTKEEITRVLTAPLIFALLINDFGLLMKALRMLRNFRYILHEKIYNVANICGDEKQCPSLIKAAGGKGSSVFYRSKTVYLNRLLEIMYEDDFIETKLTALSPYVLVAALIAGTAGGIIGGSVISAVYCLGAVVVAGIPSCRTLCMNLPLNVSSIGLSKKGVMLSGWSAVENFGHVKNVLVDSKELFPKGFVESVNIVNRSRFKQRDMLRLMASLAVASKGALADIFDDFLAKQRNSLFKIENFKYEAGLGISGFISGRELILGKPEMLIMHGVKDVQSVNHDTASERDGRVVMFFSVDGHFTGVLEIRYKPNPEISDAINLLTKEEVTLLINTNDANITPGLIYNVFDIPSRRVRVLDENAGGEYEKLTGVITNDEPAYAVTSDNFLSFAELLKTSNRLSSSLMLSSYLQLICFGLTLMLVTVLCCFSADSAVVPAQLLLPHMFCLLATLVGFVRKL